MLESIITLQDMPSLNSTVVFRDDVPDIGGTAVNVAWYLSELGKAVKLVASIGKNDVASLHNLFEKKNIDLSGLIITSGQSDYLISLLSNHEHLSIYKLGSIPSNFKNIIKSQSENCRLLIMNGGRHQATRTAFVELVRNCSTKLVAFRPSYSITEYSEQELIDIIGKTDFFIVNEEEDEFLQKLIPKSRKIREMPRQAFILTQGRKGCVLFSDKKHQHFRTHAKKEGISLGGGDALFAGFLSGLLDGVMPKDAIQIGLKLAAKAVESEKIRIEISENNFK